MCNYLKFVETFFIREMHLVPELTERENLITTLRPVYLRLHLNCLMELLELLELLAQMLLLTLTINSLLLN